MLITEMNNIDLDRYLTEKKELVNLALHNLQPVSGPEAVRAAMNYSLEAGGKRLRPILALAVAETLGYGEEDVINVACALELVHTYSLIHDDLPAMDDSDLRRGKPTCHRVYGDAIAVLAGDALLTLAFEVVAGYGMKPGRAEKAVRIGAELGRAAGVTGMIGGQVLDLEAEGRELTLPEIETISVMKTGALLKASVICGAIAADAGEKELVLLSRYATNIGTAFQIVDDLLDVESSTEDLGKPAGADQERFKPTFPAVLGPEGARSKAEALYHEAIETLDDLGRPVELLTGLAHKLVYRIK